MNETEQPAPPPTRRWWRPLLPQILGVALLIAMLATLVADAVYTYRQTLKEAAGDAQNLALLLDERFTADLREADTLLRALAETVPFTPLAPDEDAAIQTLLKRRKAQTPPVDNLLLLDAAGTVRHVANGRAGGDLGKASFFQNLLPLPEQAVFSEMIPSPDNQLPSLLAARAVKSRQGKFAGAVAASLDIYYFERLLRNLQVPPHSVLALLDGQRRLVAVYPPNLAPPGTVVGSGDPARLADQVPSNFDGMPRQYAHRALPDYPFQVVVGLAHKDVLGQWRNKVGAYALLCTILLGLSAFLLRTLARDRMHAKALEASQAELRESQRQLSAVIETAPVSLTVSQLRDGTILLANQWAGRILGQPPEDLAGRNSTDFYADPDEGSRLTSDLQDHGYVANREIRIKSADGALRWLQISARLVEYNGITAALIGGHDVTERKALEARLIEMATTDALSGLANRRHFMEEAQREARRAVRGGRPLSVLMLDVDHFKQVNDTYGHEVGDRTIARIGELLRAVGRTTDTCGRLGGEEFAVLLPDTTLPLALATAERLRAALSNAAIPLDDGQQLQVTISIGVATLDATDEGFDSLLKRADQALYRAKEQGRDRVVVDAAAPLEGT